MIPAKLKDYDYRQNLMTDPDNPILIQKAWRDRFSAKGHWDAGYGGQSYLGRPNSEDALTWNVFRSLQIAGEQGLQVISNTFRVSSVGTILFWGCDVENRGEEQQLLNILIRTVDGKHRGTMTEPDLVMITDQEVILVECKLNPPGRTSPWRSSSEGSAKRFGTYVELFPELAGLRDWREVYQMVRQYVYARSLGEHLGKRPKAIPLINKDFEAILAPYYSDLRNSLADEANVFGDFVTWQDIRKMAAASDLANKDLIVDTIEVALQHAG
jgi:hypothetical protein